MDKNFNNKDKDGNIEGKMKDCQAIANKFYSIIFLY